MQQVLDGLLDEACPWAAYIDTAAVQLEGSPGPIFIMIDVCCCGSPVCALPRSLQAHPLCRAVPLQKQLCKEIFTRGLDNIGAIQVSDDTFNLLGDKYKTLGVVIENPYGAEGERVFLLSS